MVLEADFKNNITFGHLNSEYYGTLNISDVISGNQEIDEHNIWDVAFSTTNTEHNTQNAPDFIDEQLLSTFIIVCTVVYNGAIGTVGCVLNVINILVFSRLGFKDTVNISLLSLAVADFGALLSLIWKAIIRNPYFSNWDEIPFDPLDIQYITAGTPGFCFARISSLITAFVTFERCLCIAMPLQVRRIITPKRTIIIMTSIFVLIFGSVAPMYFFIRFGPKYFPKRNKTLVGLIYSKNGRLVESFSVMFNIFIQIFAVLSVMICTIILVVELKQKSAWRSKTTGTRDSTSNVRDLKVVKMILFISIIFIICFFPSAVNLIAIFILPEYSATGRYNSLFFLIWAVFNAMEATNSSVNIFVYIRMSSKYAEVFRDIFGSEMKIGCLKKNAELKD